jgi:hypothetical protein
MIDMSWRQFKVHNFLIHPLGNNNLMDDPVRRSEFRRELLILLCAWASLLIYISLLSENTILNVAKLFSLMSVIKRFYVCRITGRKQINCKDKNLPIVYDNMMDNFLLT